MNEVSMSTDLTSEIVRKAEVSPENTGKNTGGSLSETDTAWDLWVTWGNELVKSYRTYQYQLAFHLYEGYLAFGDRIYQALADWNISEHTFNSFMTFAKYFSPETYEKNLSLSHHLVVCKKYISGEERQKFLKVALKKGLTVSELREYVLSECDRRQVPSHYQRLKLFAERAESVLLDVVRYLKTAEDEEAKKLLASVKEVLELRRTELYEE